MKKEHILIPEPNSKFLKISCKECEKENIVYSHASTSVTCKSCGNVIAEPSWFEGTNNRKNFRNC